MNFSKEQAKLLLPLLRTLTDACLNEDERKGTEEENFRQVQPESTLISPASKRKYSAQ